MSSSKDNMRKMAALFRGGMKFLFSIPNKVGQKRKTKDFATNLMMPIAEAMEAESNCYVTYNLYPKAASDQNLWVYGSGEHSSELAIVIQGPICKNNDFTLENVRMYKKFYPGVTVIISTWTSEDDNYLERFKQEENCVVVRNHYPECEGVCNINYQMVSSLRGVEKAKELGKKYVLKTRTDTRITATGILEMLTELCEQYPSESSKQMKRIVLFNAYLFMPYQEFGTYYFGHVNDLIIFFGAKLHTGKNDKNDIIQNYKTYRPMLEKGTALNWLVKCYVEKLSKTEVSCDLNEWWENIKKLFICLPVTMLRPLWVKYDYNHEESDMTWSYRREILGATGVDNTMIDFAMWRDICNGNHPCSSDYCELVDLPLR